MKYVAALLLLVTAVLAQNASTSKSHNLDIPAISRKANGSIVSIIMSDKAGNPIALGSGFIISKDGRVMTNYHVIKNGTSAVIKLPDGAFFVVDGVLASDKDRDVAVIKAQGHDFQTLALGDSSRLQVGEEVVAIGNPLSLESTVSNGIVSGIRHGEEGTTGNKLQITAPISPGSSGGPLFNMAGEVVGITTSHLTGGQSLNFAIPINDVKPMLLQARLSEVRALPNETEDDKNDPRDARLQEYIEDLQKTLEVSVTARTCHNVVIEGNRTPDENVFIATGINPRTATFIWRTVESSHLRLVVDLTKLNDNVEYETACSSEAVSIADAVVNATGRLNTDRWVIFVSDYIDPIPFVFRNKQNAVFFGRTIRSAITACKAGNIK